MYQIEFAEGVFDDLKQICAFERTHVLDEIDVQLQYEPLKQTRNRKPPIRYNTTLGTHSADMGTTRRRMACLL